MRHSGAKPSLRGHAAAIAPEFPLRKQNAL
jgi:hypothetical protein